MAAIPCTVELFYNSVWNDHTSDVRAASRVQIRRKRPAELRLAFNNHDAKYSPRNPESPLYGLIARNTPIRVSVDGDVRFVGEVESWPVRSQGSGKDVWSPITAYGIMRRLGGGGSQQLAQSALRRFVDSRGTVNVRGYWPLEDGPDVDGLRSAIGGPDMLISRLGAMVAADQGTLATWLPAGVRLPNFVAIRGRTNVSTNNTQWTVDFLYRIDAPRGDNLILTFEGKLNNLSNQVIALRLWGSGTTTPSVAEFTFPTIATSLGTTAIGTDAHTGNVLHHLRMTATQSGGNISVQAWLDGTSIATDSVAGTLVALQEVGVWYLDEPAGSTTFVSATPVSVGHIAAYDPSEAPLADAVDAAFGHAGEQAHERIERLCTEEGIAVTITGDESETLGPQGVLPPLELMHEAADVDGGVFSERRDALELAYLTHPELYNQAATTLDYSNREVWKLEPSEDTDHLANVVTATRRDGGESTVERDGGTLGTTTVGRYPVRVTLSLEDDGQTLQQAAWRSHIGTWDEPRYPNIGVNLAGLIAAGQTTLANAVAAVDVGSHLAVENPPDWAGPDSVSVHVDGYFEEIGSHTWTVEHSGSPARPYAVGVLDTDRLDTAGCVTTEPLDTTESGVNVDSTSTARRWSSTAVPYDIVIGGERMTVIVVSGATSLQTLTVLRSVDGVVKSHATGASVRLYQPLRLTRGA